MDDEMAARRHDGLRTALALTLAQWRGDGEAMVRLWRDTSDRDAVVHGLAALPTLAVERFALDLGVECDVGAWFEAILLAMAARDN